jgi:membrane protease YdiL (CAAX protease family)
MKNLFYNPFAGRIRAGWRILIFLALFWVLAATSLVIKPLFGNLTKREYLSNYSLIIVLILAVAATVAVWFSRRHLDKKSFRSLGLKISKRSWMDLIFGFFLSALMAGTFLLLTLQFGLVEITGFNWGTTTEGIATPIGFTGMMQSFTLATLLLLFLEHLMVGYWEELVFRGYLFQNITEGLGLIPAILISCLLYGSIHYLNPNATYLSSIIIILFGFLRIYGYLATGMLWLSIGMHIGWNFFQGPIFGFAASGHQKATWLELNFSGPDWLSGGSFGPEGSLLIIPIVLLALWIMKKWSRRGETAYKVHTSIS